MALLPLAREAVGLSVRIDEAMASLKGGIYGHLLVACSTTPGKYILPHLLAQFHERYPQVRVTCQVFPQVDALQSLEDGNAHFALFSLPHDGFPNVEALTFIRDPITLITPLDHPWAKRGEIDAQELVEGNFIMREASSGTFSAVRDALAQKNVSISDLRILITLGNAEAIALAVQEGIGVGFVSQLVIDRLCKGKVAEIRVRDTEINRQIRVGRNSRRMTTNAQKAFWDFLALESSDLTSLRSPED
jgi:DNA-binding transcriptional LysR family regulator